MLNDEEEKGSAKAEPMVRKYLKKFWMIYFLFVFLGIIGLSASGGDLASSQSSSSLQIYFFYAEDCQPCQVILQS
jgi:Trk-type K+ transport system membrane component